MNQDFRAPQDNKQQSATWSSTPRTVTPLDSLPLCEEWAGCDR